MRIKSRSYQLIENCFMGITGEEEMTPRAARKKLLTITNSAEKWWGCIHLEHEVFLDSRSLWQGRYAYALP
jgi:hypothetical protein